MEKFLNLLNIHVNNKAKAVNNNYYVSDSHFSAAKDSTKNTPEIFGENVTINVKSNNATSRDLQARDILAKYISGVSGYNNILGSALEDVFVKFNSDDFAVKGTIVRNGKEYKNYEFDSTRSDGKITMPTLQNYNGEEFYVFGDQTFDKYGNIYASEMDKNIILGRYGHTPEAYDKITQLKQEGRYD